MGKTGWQTVALFAIAWAVAASAIAWVNKGQIEHHPVPESNAAEIAELREALVGLQRHNEQLTTTLLAYADSIPAGATAESRCLDGIRFKTINGALTDVGQC